MSIEKPIFSFSKNRRNKFKNKIKSRIKRKKKYVCFCFIFFIFFSSYKYAIFSNWVVGYFSFDNQITLKVKGSGDTNIIYSGFSLPSQILLNTNYIEVNSRINLPSGENMVILKWNNRVISCVFMFYGCDKITEIDFSQFDSSSVSFKMNNMFYGCTSLSSVNFGNFDTSRVTDMGSLFYNCKSLISLDLSGFDTSEVTDFFNMFYNCESLQSINLSGFKTNNANRICHMFYGCRSLKSLDLSSFETPKVQHIEEMFYGCENLEFVNLKKSIFDSNKILYYYDVLVNATKKIVFCMDEGGLDGFNRYFISSNPCAALISNCNSDWKKAKKKQLMVPIHV